MAKLLVDVWSDIACPWCYIGKRRLESALARFDHREEVEIHYRAFELDPSAPRRPDRSVSQAQRLARKYGTTAAEAQRMIDRVVQVAAQDGLDFQMDRLIGGNTFDAHRLLAAARAAGKGKQAAVKERFLRGYFTEGAAIGDLDTLSRLAGEAGLDADIVSSVLSSDAFTKEVRADQAEARAIGCSGVPFFVIAGKYAVSGAQPAEVLLRGLSMALADLPAASEAGEGEACSADGCA